MLEWETDQKLGRAMLQQAWQPRQARALPPWGLPCSLFQRRWAVAVCAVLVRV